MIFFNNTDFKINKVAFDRLARFVLVYLKKNRNLEFEFILVSEDEIRRLNKKYRKIDKVTDVLSFVIEEDLFLGQIFVCTTFVYEQASNHKKDRDREMAEVFVHGLLHLIGYDDVTEAGWEKMVNLQKKILNLFFEQDKIN